ncbi:hypothetical protein R77564_03956 [Ralstonia sp. LMG 32965]|uniref:Transposase n=1 Tax=Ralstonia flatus TaxID=3058601 RepID=A0ABM9L0V7_9RALS|nr:hypothetical protein R77564_03956 [Ralstonia sp. LMG 32965]
MAKQRRSFSPEFKQQAASLVLDQGYSHIEASRSVGVAESVLRRWVQQLQMERQGITPQGKAMTADQQRIQELEARIERLEREKVILKNVWSAPVLQAVFADVRRTFCVNVSGLRLRTLLPGLDGIRARLAS